MTVHNVTLTGLFTVTKGPRDKSWRAEVSCDLDALSSDMVERLAMHGLQQKIADAASGATTETEAVGAMGKAIDAIVAGTWTSRVAGAGVDEETHCARLVIRPLLRTNWGAKSAKWVEFTGLDDDVQDAKLDQVRADNPTLFEDAIARKMSERAASRADKAKLGKGITINI